jgi:tight adherence protein C
MIQNSLIAFAVLLLVAGIFLIVRATLRNAPEDLTQRVSGGLAYPSLKPDSNPARSLSGLVKSLKAMLATKAASGTILQEMPDVLDLLSVSVSAGDGIYAALCRVTPRCAGKFANEIQLLLRRVQLGETLEAALVMFANENPLTEVREFANKLSLALRRGTPLAQLLSDQAETIRAQLRNDLLKAAGRNETRMLIPLVFLILPVTVLFAIYPSLQLLQLTI